MKNLDYCILILAVLILASAMPAMADVNENKIITISLVNQDPDPAVAGNVVEIRLGVENVGGVAAQNEIIELVEAYPFTIVSGEEAVQVIGSLKAFQDEADMKIIKYKIMVDRDATAGQYEMKVREHEEGSDTITQRGIMIEVKNKESAEIIHIDKTTLIPGKESSLKFTINNVGNAPLRDLSFYWENDDEIILPVGSDNTRYIKYIDVSESAELEYRVIADSNADAGLYKLDLHLTYDDPSSDEDEEVSTIAGVYVGGGTDFDIAFSESSNGEISFSVANIGSNPAFSVSVIVPEQQGWRVTGSNSAIIGNLNKGDYTVASFAMQSLQARQYQSSEGTAQQDTAQQASSAQKPGSKNTLKIQVDYTDTMGERKRVEKEVSVNSQSTTATTLSGGSQADAGYPFARRSQKSFFSAYKWHIIAVIVLVIFGLIFWRYRKERALDPDYKLRHLFRKKKKAQKRTQKD